MFNKRINLTLDPNYTHVIDNELLKTAGIQDLLNGHRFDPDFVYLLVRSVSAGEYWGPNNNTDFFEESELLPNYHTFLDAKLFKNHDNKDVAAAIGDVLKAEWDDAMKAVMLVVRVDKTIAPTIARGFLKGTITDVSMGCRVDHVICSVCGVRAKTRKDYCEHLRDPQLRGKIMPGGKRVYEINKGPKFHDISVVTKGADRTAKAFVVADGADIAKKNELSKVASLDARLEGLELKKEYAVDYKLTPEDLGFKKIASDISMMKLAEIDKIIQGNLVAIAGAKKYNDFAEKSDEVMDVLRLFYTKYFDEETTSAIAEKIKAIAAQKKRAPQDVFRTFLRTAELSGIELTPLEFSAISRKICGNKADNPFEVSEKIIPSIDPGLIKVMLRLSRSDHNPRIHGLNLGPQSFRGAFPGPEVDLEEDIFKSILAPFMSERSMHPRHFEPRVIKIIKIDQSPQYDNLKHFILPLMGMSKVAGEVFENDVQNYFGYQNDRVALAQSGDLDKYAGIVTGEDIEFIKEAGLGKRLFFNAALYPLIQGYSKYQQSRINNGERVGSFNQYIAQNPLNAFAVASVGVHYGRKNKKILGEAMDDAGATIKRNAGKAKSKAIVTKQKAARKGKDLANKSKDIFDKANSKIHPTSINPVDPKIEHVVEQAVTGDNLTAAVDPNMLGQNFNLRSMGKVINKSVPDVGSSKGYFGVPGTPKKKKGYFGIEDKHAGEEFSIFNSEEINAQMLEKYSAEKVDIIKLATVEYFKGDESYSEEILGRHSLEMSDMNYYLKTAMDLITIELENLTDSIVDKYAGAEDIALDTVNDTLFYPKITGAGMGTLLPGSLIDGFIFDKMSKKLTNDATKKNMAKTTPKTNMEPVRSGSGQKI